MKRKNLIFTTLLLMIFIDKTYAFQTTASFIDNMTLALFGLMILGALIVVISKIKSAREQEQIIKETKIKSLKSKEEPQNNKQSFLRPVKTEEDKLIEKENIFNEFSIYKYIPSFSKKEVLERDKILAQAIVYNDVEKFRTLKDEMDNDLFVKKINTIGDLTKNIYLYKVENERIINFEENENNYVLVHRMLISYKQGKEYKYFYFRITSILEKENKPSNVRCPICGGKIENIDELRCKHCNSIIPREKETKQTNDKKWIIKDYEIKETTF